MFQWILKKIKEDNKGFTLIELIVVIAIIAVLALIVVPKVTGQTKEADVAAHNANVRTLESAATMYIAEEGVPSELVTWPTDDSWEKYLQEWPTVPKSVASALGQGKDTYTVEIKEDGTITVTPKKAEIGEDGTIKEIGSKENGTSTPSD
ncbi:prepilin-type N-terminal cleavage/methylation domain-containing protein [Keratinibaculum paraultunense]|uniref:Prepilin-type N-terminal cleavage/methylation domain-containing protein n=1 Tax=Keratinibaculum paraultunense TaxID=1278232 RepID=A0A4R3KYP6_9FIRM|nr:prepilin-type N-terminal cleavage/methylation domain-containing protein [Keratinibaculum paraultunense]QQY80588.1 prepilin-type N-terminal cleavage/methylation domain-containing protein [Keratinibaculum paraultunense]TCS91318.1 prepilin-type N-terminal cleavage/methylation domain-containing protein [Keratinibaculum paraultunense]